MDSLSKEERVQLALKAFNYGRNDTPCSLTFISSLQASLGKGESFFGVEDYTKIWIGSFMGPVVFMAGTMMNRIWKICIFFGAYEPSRRYLETNNVQVSQPMKVWALLVVSFKGTCFSPIFQIWYCVSQT